MSANEILALIEEPMASTDQASLDRLKRFGGGKLLGEMVALYLAAAPERLALASDGLAANNVKQVEDALHSLKSSSAQLGAMRMRALCERGEITARAGSLEHVDQLMKALYEEFPRVQTWLESARGAEES